MSEPNPTTDSVTANAGSGGASFAGWSISSVFWPLVRMSFGTGANSYEVDDVTGQRLPVKLAEIGSVTLPLPTGAATSAKQDSIITALGSPFQAGASIGNTSFGISGTLPAFASTPTVNLGTLNGAATAAKQPALGTAGTASSDVITVQGIASMTALKVDLSGTAANSTAIKVDGSAVTQPVSIADGSSVTLGSKADAKSTATDTTSISMMSVLKQISASVQAPPSQAVTNAGTFAVQATLQAGSAIAGKVGIDQTTPGTTDSVTVKSSAYSAAVSQTRPNDTSAYTANDVLGTATGSTAALTFAIAPSGGGEVMITSAALEEDATAVISGEVGYRLHLYNVTPPSALGDNAAWDLPSGDRASYLGYIDLGQPVDLGSTLYIESNGINKQIKAASGNVYGYLVTLGGFTPAAQSVKVITLHSIAL